MKMKVEREGEFYWVIDCEGKRVTDVGYFYSESEAIEVIESLVAESQDAWAEIKYAHACGYHS